MQYPYIPNSNKAVRREMLDFIRAQSVKGLYSFIPDEIRMKRPLDLPDPLVSEMTLKKHVNGILNKNSFREENISFLSAGCYNHHSQRNGRLVPRGARHGLRGRFHVHPQRRLCLL